MANSRIMLTCKHCGGQIAIGKGYLGAYFTNDTKIYDRLNKFFDTHQYGECCTEYSCFSDDAKDHFVILEEGETLDLSANMDGGEE